MGTYDSIVLAKGGEVKKGHEETAHNTTTAVTIERCERNEKVRRLYEENCVK